MLNLKHPQQHYADRLAGIGGMLKIEDAAFVLDVSNSGIEKLIDLGELSCHAYNGGKGIRFTKRIPQESILLYLLKTDTLPPEDQLETLLSVIGRRSAEEKQILLKALTDSLNA